MLFLIIRNELYNPGNLLKLLIGFFVRIHLVIEMGNLAVNSEDNGFLGITG